jgi:putative glycosyltransferase (TIGR04348 family)
MVRGVRHHILIITPAPRGSRIGNRVTAERWAKQLDSLGHIVRISEKHDGQKADILIALHARKSARSIARFHRDHPNHPIIVVLTGTDLYHDLKSSRSARRSLELAFRLLVLQAEAVHELPGAFRQKVRVIFQSALPPRSIPLESQEAFEVCVVGHLRAVKDPFRAALAARMLPACSRIRIIQIGGALSAAIANRALREMDRNPRFTWLGERSHEQTLRRMAQCRAMVLSSRSEGGANVISEAVVAGVPVLASRIPGSIGLLGRQYPGYFTCGDTAELAKLLNRIETDSAFLNRLRSWCEKLQSCFAPENETQTWRDVLSELP